MQQGAIVPDDQIMDVSVLLQPTSTRFFPAHSPHSHSFMPFAHLSTPLQLLDKRLEDGRKQGEKGFILDGFPRTHIQVCKTGEAGGGG